MDDDDRRARGTAIRRAVLGDAHVDRAATGATPLTADFQEFIERYAWGDLWARDGLDRQTRSLITLVILIAVNREDEFRLHLRGAINNGVSADEIKETIMHSAIYVGVPAANAAFRAASEELAKLEKGA